MHDDFPAQLAAFVFFANTDRANAAVQMKPVAYRPLTVALATNVRYHAEFDSGRLSDDDREAVREVAGG
jgi:hypothetical protein